MQKIVDRIHEYSPINRVAYLLISIFLVSSQVHAVELSESLRLNGFLTFGASTVDKEGVVYSAYPDQPDGAEKGELDFQTNSLVGLQLEYDISDDLSMTLQGISRKNAEGNFAPTLEWAYLTYTLRNDLDIRAGLLHIPLQRNTELNYINYTRTWATNPFVSQFARGYSKFKGAELLYHDYFGSYGVTVQASYGVDKPDIEDTDMIDEYKSDNIKVISIEVSKEMARIKLAYMLADTKYQRIAPPDSLDHIEGGWDSVEQGTTKQQFYSIDVEVPIYGTVLSGGLTYGKSGDFFPPTQNLYASVAYPYEKITPYLLYSNDYIEFEKINTKIEKDTYSVGVRYDIIEGLALKGQMDNIYEDDMFHEHENSISSTNYHAFTLLVDWIF